MRRTAPPGLAAGVARRHPGTLAGAAALAVVAAAPAPLRAVGRRVGAALVGPLGRLDDLCALAGPTSLRLAAALLLAAWSVRVVLRSARGWGPRPRR